MDIIGKEMAQYDLDVTEATIPTIYNNTESILYPAPHQEMLELDMDFSTTNRRLAVWPTGAGKTNGALLVAKRFIENSAKKTALRPENAEAIEAAAGSLTTPKPSGVKVIGFTEDIFVKELITFPELGVVTFDEINETKRLEEDGTPEELHKHILSLRRKVRDRSRGGYYEFYGNKELFQQLFLEVETGKIPTVRSYEELKQAIEDGRIVVQRLIDAFRDSLIICDEIHNVYNRKDSNSYGLAINYILDNTNAKALFISATPISNSQNEIVSIMNLLSEKRQKYTSSNFFDSSGNITEKGKAIILKEAKGKVSYIKNTNVNDFPRWSWAGREVAGIPRMKFVKVPITQEHFQIYKSLPKGVLGDAQDEEEIPESLQGIETEEGNSGFVNDLYLKPIDGSGLINTMRDLSRHSKASAPRIRTKSLSDKTPRDPFYFDKVTGIGIEEEFDVETYAPKYYQLIGDLIGLSSGNTSGATHGSTSGAAHGSTSGAAHGKSIIYHNNVKNNGIFFISQILDLYGFTKYNSAPRDNAICFHCGKEKFTHSGKVELIEINTVEELKSAIATKPAAQILVKDEKVAAMAIAKGLQEVAGVGGAPQRFVLDDEAGCLNFSPRRYVMIWSDASVDVEKILKVYNSVENATGVNIEIVLGSKKIKESLDFKAVRRIFVTARPPSISTLIQIIGRGIRNKSHNQLAKKDRTVEIFVYVHSYKGSSAFLDELSAYKDRMDSFLKFKELEELLYVGSINAFTYPDMTNPEVAKRTYKQVLDTYILEKKMYPREEVWGDTTIITSKKERFDLLYTKMEIDKIKQIIKSLFLESPIWEYNDLVVAIVHWSQNHFWNTNTAYLDRGNIDAALMELVHSTSSPFIDVDNEKFNTTFRSINSSGKTILTGGKEYNIIPFSMSGASYFKLQRVETLAELTPLTLFNDTAEKPQTLVYDEFTISLRKAEGFDPEEFLRTTPVKELIYEVDALIGEEQAQLLAWIVNDLGMFSENPTKGIPKATLSNIANSVFFLIFTGIFLVKMVAPSGANAVLRSLKAVTENIYSVEPGSMNTLNRVPMQYHPVAAEVEKWVTTKGTLSGLLEPIRVVQKKPLVYRNGKLVESQFVEHTNHKENTVIVGYMERDPKSGKKVFKLREPNREVPSNEKVDQRKIKKGSFFMNIPRDKLEGYVKALEPGADISAYVKKEDIGNHLKYLLRQLDKNSTDGTRYFYW